jgi:hypothetical protein
LYVVVTLTLDPVLLIAVHLAVTGKVPDDKKFQPWKSPPFLKKSSGNPSKFQAALPVYQSLTTLFTFPLLSSVGECNVARSYLDDDRAYRRRNILLLVQLSMMVQRIYGKAVKVSTFR